MKPGRLEWIIAVGACVLYYFLRPGAGWPGDNPLRWESIPALGLNALAALAMLYPLVIIHELGHVLAGRAAGVEILKVQIGSGRRIAGFRFLGIEWIFCASLAGGLTYPGKFPPLSIRRGLFFLALGGALAQSIAAAAGFAAMDSGWSNSLEERGLYIPHLFAGINLLMTALSLNPVTAQVMGAPALSDGGRLLRIPSMTDAEMEDYKASAHIAGGCELMMNNDYAGAEEAFRGGLEAAPGSMMLRNNLASALTLQCRCGEAKEILDRALGAGPSRLIEAYLRLNVAAVLIYDGSPEAIRGALEHSRVAYKAFPGFEAAASVWSAALIESGRTEEGIGILEKFVRPSQAIQKLQNTPMGHIYLAYGYHLTGESRKAAMLAEKVESAAGQLSPYDSALLLRAKRRMIPA